MNFKSLKLFGTGILFHASFLYFKREFRQFFKPKPRFSLIETPIQEMRNNDFYVSYYSRERKIPIAVEIILTKKSLKGDAKRKNSRFREDLRIPARFRSFLRDYWSKWALLGLNRGHMVGAGDISNSQEGKNSTFLLSNILPQDGDNN